MVEKEYYGFELREKLELRMFQDKGIDNKFFFVLVGLFLIDWISLEYGCLFYLNYYRNLIIKGNL